MRQNSVDWFVLLFCWLYRIGYFKKWRKEIFLAMICVDYLVHNSALWYGEARKHIKSIEQIKIHFPELDCVSTIHPLFSPEIIFTLPSKLWWIVSNNICFIRQRALHSLDQNLSVVPGPRDIQLSMTCWWNSLPNNTLVLQDLNQIPRACNAAILCQTLGWGQ